MKVISTHVISEGFHLLLVLLLVAFDWLEIDHPPLLVILSMLFLNGGIHHVLLPKTVTGAALDRFLLLQLVLILVLHFMLEEFVRVCLHSFLFLHLQYIVSEAFTVKPVLLSLLLLLAHLVCMTLFDTGFGLLLHLCTFVLLRGRLLCIFLV